MAHEAIKVLILKIIEENPHRLDHDTEEWINLKFLSAHPRLDGCPKEIILKTISEMIEENQIRCTVKPSRNNSAKISNFAIQELY
ncbi:hypothetical protein [Bacillus mycoides]|uniref:hypothetical protein n=1 Tax=Bacillus mycoides TaxID=1405 RepID=UPI003D076935